MAGRRHATSTVVVCNNIRRCQCSHLLDSVAIAVQAAPAWR